MAITQLNAVKSLPYIVSNVMALLTCLPMAIGIMAFGKLFSELSENKMLAVTGMISYEIYLVHAFTLGMIKPSVVSVLAFVVVTVTLAYVTYFTIGKMKKANLTIIILTKNEEQNLEKCIASFKSVAQRIVIIDSYSTDKTVELAKSLGAEVYEHPFENHAVQFNWALDNIDLNTEWVMKVDADEEFTSELADEIDEKLDTLSAKVNGVILRRRVYFMGRWLKHGGKYPELLLRIFRVGHGMSEMKLMDEHLIVTDGDVVTFKNDFSDNNNKSLEWWINKHNWYSNKEVLDQQMKSDDANGEESVEETSTSMQAKVKRFVKNHGYYSLPKFFRAHLYFIYRYYFRFGFLDGTEGKIYTFLQAYWYRYLVDAKLYECEKLGVKMEKQGALEATSSRINGGG